MRVIPKKDWWYFHCCDSWSQKTVPNFVALIITSHIIWINGFTKISFLIWSWSDNICSYFIVVWKLLIKILWLIFHWWFLMSDRICDLTLWLMICPIPRVNDFMLKIFNFLLRFNWYNSWWTVWTSWLTWRSVLRRGRRLTTSSLNKLFTFVRLNCSLWTSWWFFSGFGGGPVLDIHRVNLRHFQLRHLKNSWLNNLCNQQQSISQEIVSYCILQRYIFSWISSPYANETCGHIFTAIFIRAVIFKVSVAPSW